MIAMQVSLSLAALFGWIACSFIVGFLLQRRQIAKRQIKIMELRKEMVENHAEILGLQKEFADLEKAEKASRTPVRPLTPLLEVRDAVR